MFEKFSNFSVSFSSNDVSGRNHFIMRFECDHTDEIGRDIQQRKNQLIQQNPNFKLKGFRKGKEPLNLVVQAFGKDYFFIPMILESLEVLYAERARLFSRIIAVMGVSFDNGKFMYQMIVERFDELDVGDKYRGIELVRQSDEVTDDEIQKEIDRVLMGKRKMKPKTDGVVEQSDCVVFDYKTETNGQIYDEDATVVLGTNDSRWTAEFEQTLIGKKVGDEFNTVVVFADDHKNFVFVGKELMFEIRVREIRSVIVPELNDKFVKQFEVNTVDEFREKLVNNLKTMKKNHNENYYYTEIEKQLIERYDLEAMYISDTFVDMELDKKVASYEKMYRQNFVQLREEKPEEYEKFIAETRNQILTGTKIDVLLQNISNSEDIRITSEDMEDAKKEFTHLQQAPNSEGIISFLRRRKAMEKIFGYATFKEIEAQ